MLEYDSDTGTLRTAFSNHLISTPTPTTSNFPGLSSIPKDILRGSVIDLSKWTIILVDDDLKTLSIQKEDKTFYEWNSFLKTSFPLSISLPSSFPSLLSSPLSLSTFQGLLSLDVSNSSLITDYGISLVVRNNRNLQSINLYKCIEISDIGIREIGLHCNKLSKLNISYCIRIVGGGLVSISENCKQLVAIHIMGCQSIESWAFIKLFSGLIGLKELNVSNINNIGDEEITCLSKCCPSLHSLHASHCPNITDSSIIELFKKCNSSSSSNNNNNGIHHHLTDLDLSRSEYSTTISDVSLSFMKNTSISLQRLNLSGCNQITDIGIAWLCEGNKNIKELDVSNCSKITDISMRVIAFHCGESLENLNLSYDKRISDIGIHELISSCHRLKYINWKGLVLLHDHTPLQYSKQSYFSKGYSYDQNCGSQSQFNVNKNNEEESGLSSLALNCPEIQTLCLSGCFALNLSLKKSLSNLLHLQELNLSGCKGLTMESSTEIFTKCKNLVKVNLSRCNRGVSNTIISALVQRSKSTLKSLVLSHCVTGIRGSAIRSLSHCQVLEYLDLSGCKGLTDMMLLPITNEIVIQSLKYLLLVDLNRITSTFIAWIAQSNHHLYQLSLKGTSITYTILQAFQKQFPNSDLKCTDDFFGYNPIYRIKDVQYMTAINRLLRNIVLVQSVIRRYIAWKKYQGLKQIDS